MSINNAIYDHYQDRWYTANDDPVALLRAESKAKFPWVLEKIQHYGRGIEDLVLDVGCGAGFLSNALAQEGFAVTGVDLSEESLKVAQRFDNTKTVQYMKADAYELPFGEQTFGVVTAMDFLEHVEDPCRVIAEASRVLKSGGLFFYHTFNRNVLSHLVVIKLVEWLVKNTPKDMHVIDLFITPQELEDYCYETGLEPLEVIGLRPVLSSVPLKNYFSGVVPESLQFTTTKSTLLSYLGCAIKI